MYSIVSSKFWNGNVWPHISSTWRLSTWLSQFIMFYQSILNEHISKFMDRHQEWPGHSCLLVHWYFISTIPQAWGMREALVLWSTVAGRRINVREIFRQRATGSLEFMEMMVPGCNSSCHLSVAIKYDRSMKFMTKKFHDIPSCLHRVFNFKHDFFPDIIKFMW